MKANRLLFFLSLPTALAIAAACGEDHAEVRERLPGAGEGGVSADAGDAGSCNVNFPTTYDSPTYDTNAAAELKLRNNFDNFVAPMKNIEAALAADAGTPTPITKAQLDALDTAGDPSTKASTTTYYQAKIDAWLGAYETALVDGTYTPDAPDGGDRGGTYGGFVFDPTGLDLRQVIEKGSYAALFYNEAAGVIAGGAFTVGSIDRLVAAFGAHPSFPNNASSGQNKDVNAAALAAHRDAKDAVHVGPYQRIRSALIKARAAVEAGAGCVDVRNAALKIFLSEWERSNYATVIFDLNDVITRLSASPTNYALALHSYGEAVGLAAGFKGIPQDRRIITDAQIDSLLQKIYAPDGTPSQAFNLALQSVSAASALQQAMTMIQGIYSFSNDDVEAFKKDN